MNSQSARLPQTLGRNGRASLRSSVNVQRPRDMRAISINCQRNSDFSQNKTFGQRMIQSSRDTKSRHICTRARQIDDKQQETPQLYLTLDFLKALEPSQMQEYIEKTPVFLRTLHQTKYIDPKIISLLFQSIDDINYISEIMSNEINIHSALLSAKTFDEVEGCLTKYLPIKSATIWTRVSYSNILASETLKVTIPYDDTILLRPFLEKSEIITSDPSNSPHFSVVNDMPYLRGMRSTAMFPLFNGDRVTGVLQCCGFQPAHADFQIDFDSYTLEVLRIANAIIQEKFFSGWISPQLPFTASEMFSGFKDLSMQKEAEILEAFLKTEFQCRDAFLYEFDDAHLVMKRITTGEIIRDGEIYEAGLKTTPCCTPTSLNRSIRQGAEHFVLSLNSKSNQPSFNNNDIWLVDRLAPSISDALSISRMLEKCKDQSEKMESSYGKLQSIVSLLNSVSREGKDPRAALNEACKQLFGCDTFYVCIFDGRFMIYQPSGIKCKFEECASGASFNSREKIVTRENDTGFNQPLYKQLGHECKLAVSFPYRVLGKVVGSIELINPKSKEIEDDNLLEAFSSICSFLYL